jgi:hypothetical protein
MNIALPSWLPYQGEAMPDDRRESDSDVKSLLDNFLAEQRRIEAQRAKEQARRDQEAFKHSKAGITEMADRLLHAFNDHEKKDDARHNEVLSSNLKLGQRIDSVTERVDTIEQAQLLAARPKWKESDSGMHMIADIQAAAADEAAWKLIQQRQEVTTWRGVKSWTTQIVIGVLVLVIAALIWTNLRLAAPGEHREVPAAR